MSLGSLGRPVDPRFEMCCPKCGRTTGYLETDTKYNRFGALNPVLCLIYSCFMCGNRIHGQAVEDEFKAQLEAWEERMRNPHPELITPYRAPPRSLSLPSKKDLSRAVAERGDPSYIPDLDPEFADEFEFKVDTRPVATTVVTEVRTSIKCGEFGYWCHGTCRRHGRCMYLPRTRPVQESGAKCANDRCDKDAAPTSKYCSKACGNRKASRDAYNRKKAKNKN